MRGPLLRAVRINKKFSEIIHPLDLAWEPPGKSARFQVAFSKYRVGSEASRKALNNQWATVYRPSVAKDAGDVIKSIDSLTGDPLEPSARREIRERLKTIFEGARRRAMGVDAALTDRLAALDA